MREKESIKNLKAYVVDDIDCKVKLDANEGNPNLFKNLLKDSIDYNLNLNIYPDNAALELKSAIKEYINIETSNILVGNGSSEMIELVIKTFVDKDDTVLSFDPSFSMYAVDSQIYGAKFIGVESDENFVLDINKIIEVSNQNNPKLILLCNPNNPTGYLLKREEIIMLLENTDSLVVVDEAYIEFASESVVDKIEDYENLIVLRTLSKAFSLAAIRVGYMVTNETLIQTIEKVRPPYNLNTISQFIAKKALENKDIVLDYIKEVKMERALLYGKLKNLGIKVYDSHTNFILFYCEIENIKQKLIDRDVLIRDFGGKMQCNYRVTVGNKFENKIFIEAMQEILQEHRLSCEIL